MLRISKYVERKILIHKRLTHPYLVKHKEVRAAASISHMYRLLHPHTRALQCCICSCLGCSSTPFQNQTGIAQGVTGCACLPTCWLVDLSDPACRGVHLATHNPVQPCPPLYLQVLLMLGFLAIVMEDAAAGYMFQLVMRQKGLPEAEAR